MAPNPFQQKINKAVLATAGANFLAAIIFFGMYFYTSDKPGAIWWGIAGTALVSAGIAFVLFARSVKKKFSNFN